MSRRESRRMSQRDMWGMSQRESQRESRPPRPDPTRLKNSCRALRSKNRSEVLAYVTRETSCHAGSYSSPHVTTDRAGAELSAP